MVETFPLCFGSLKEYDLWRTSWRCPASHCVDCMPTYQLRMKTLRRCEHPETMFSFDENGGVVGIA